MKGWAVLKSVLTHSVCFNLLSSCEKRAWQPEPHSLAGESNLDQRLHGLPKASAAKVSQGRAPRTPGSQFGAFLTPLPLLDFVGDFIKQKRGKKKNNPPRVALTDIKCTERALVGSHVPRSAQGLPQTGG